MRRPPLIASRVLAPVRRLAFRVWTLELRLALYRAGARLELRTSGPVTLRGRPHVTVSHRGEGNRVLVLEVGSGVQIGRDLRLDLHAHATNRLSIGDNCVVEDLVRIQLFGGEIHLGEAAVLRDFAVLKSEGTLRVGHHTLISYGCVVHCSNDIRIGAHNMVTEHVTIIDSDHDFSPSDGDAYNAPVIRGSVSTGDNVMLGAGVVVTRNAAIGSDAAVAAGAVVRHGDHAGATLHAGVPSRPVKRLDTGR